jgi:hypothetical protein
MGDRYTYLETEAFIERFRVHLLEAEPFLRRKASRGVEPLTLDVDDNTS